MTCFGKWKLYYIIPVTFNVLIPRKRSSRSNKMCNYIIYLLYCYDNKFVITHFDSTPINGAGLPSRDVLLLDSQLYVRR